MASHPRTSCRTCIGRRAALDRRSIGSQIVTLRTDAHISQRRLAAAAGIAQAHLSRIERGLAEPSFAVLEAIAAMLGANLSVRLLPTTGPMIRDRIQASIVEALLRDLHPSWKRIVEVTVRRPVRGTIDVVLACPGAPVVAVEVHSEIRRLEQQIRWAADKADALPSADGWSMIEGGAAPGRPSRLLVLRSTHATRELARTYEETLRTAYPAPCVDAVGALTKADRPWPGCAVVWAEVTCGRTRILARPPRGIALGA
jgi:transcriptional regulator with XRE-family HTH domain